MKFVSAFVASVVVAFGAPALAEPTIQASRARLKFHEVVNDTTHASGGLIIGGDTPLRGVIEFLDDSDRPLPELYPIETLFLSLGATIGGSVSGDVEMKLYRTSGKSVRDILGNYVGLRAGRTIPFATMLTRYAGVRGAVYYQPSTGVVIPDWTYAHGAMLEASVGQLRILPRAQREEYGETQRTVADWNARIELR